MKLIERYVYAVTEHLPEDIRDDVGKELRANIEDMLPDNPTDADVYKVLEELGNPYKLASEYNPKKRYLIGPGLYDRYISVLKLVIGICAAVFFGLCVFGWAMEPPFGEDMTRNFTSLFTDLFSAVFEGVLQAALWVTIVFVVLERNGVESGYLPFGNKKWTPNDLPEVPVQNKKKISRGETVFSMILTIFFTAFLYFQPEYIALYYKGVDRSMKIIPLFASEVLRSYMSIIVLLAVLQIGIFIWKFIRGNWNVALAIANALYNVAISILLIVMLNDNSLFNPNFFSTFAHVTDAASQNLAMWLDRSKWMFLVVFIAICIWDSIAGFINSIGKVRA